MTDTRLLSTITPVLTKVLPILLLGSSFFATAESKDPQASPITVGAGVIYLPKYTGADKYRVRAVPIASATFGRLSLGGLNGISYDIVQTKGLQAGVSLGYIQGRDESDSKHLRGLGDLDSALTIGTYFKQTFGAFYVAGNVKRDFSDDIEGMTAGLSAGHSYRISPKIMLNSAISTRWMDDDYAQAVFGINQTQSIASGLAVTTVESGIESASLTFTGLYFIDKQWTINAMIGTTKYMGDAKESPITREENPYMFMTGVSYRF